MLMMASQVVSCEQGVALKLGVNSSEQITQYTSNSILLQSKVEDEKPKTESDCLGAVGLVEKKNFSTKNFDSVKDQQYDSENNLVAFSSCNLLPIHEVDKINQCLDKACSNKDRHCFENSDENNIVNAQKSDSNLICPEILPQSDDEETHSSSSKVVTNLEDDLDLPDAPLKISIDEQELDSHYGCDNLENELQNQDCPKDSEKDIISDKCNPLSYGDGFYYHFKLNSDNIIKNKRRKFFRCEICYVKYCHMFTLKRHYLKTHINVHYLSEQDLLHCSIDKPSSNVDSKSSLDEVNNADDASSKELQIVVNVHGNNYEYSVIKDASCNKPTDKKLVGKLFKCNFCRETFDTKDDLMSHLTKHPSSKNVDGSFRCHVCDMSFPLKRYLLRHMIVHKGKKKRVAKGDVVENESKASEFRDFTCSQCSKSFSNVDELKMHIQSHDKTAFVEADMARSLRAGAKFPMCRYGCTECKKLFSSYTNMCRHRRLAHHVSQRMNGRFKAFHSPMFQVKDKNTTNQQKTINEVNIDSEYYENLSKSIRNNLTCYMDGKIEMDPAESMDDNADTSLDPLNLENEMNFCCNTFDSREEEPDSFVDEDHTKSFLKSYEKIIDTARRLLQECDDESFHRMKPFEELVIPYDDASLFVCYTCHSVFFNESELQDHKFQDHPTIHCTHLEMIGETECPPEVIHNHNDNVGMISCYDAEEILANDNLKCTKCNSEMSSVLALHSHILECGEDKSHISWRPSFRRKCRKKAIKRQIRDDNDDIDEKFHQKDEFADVRKLYMKVNSKESLSRYDLQSSSIPPDSSTFEPPDQELRCEGCYMKFDYIAALDRHQRACTMARRLNGIKSSARGLYSRHNPTSVKRQCQHCLRTFNYQASLRKHMEEGCIQKDIGALQKKYLVKKDKFPIKKKISTVVNFGNPVSVKIESPISEEKGNKSPSVEAKAILRIESQEFLCGNCKKPFKDMDNYAQHLDDCCPAKTEQKAEVIQPPVVSTQVKDALNGMIKTQVEQKKVLSYSKAPGSSSKLQTFSCSICHMIYFSYVELLKHRLSHKLEKCKEENSNEDEVTQVTKDDEKIVMAVEKPPEENLESSTALDESPPPSHDNKIMEGNEDSSTCPICGRLFASPLNMGRHKRMAHGIIRAALNKRRLIISQQSKEEKAMNTPFRVSAAKISRDVDGETQFIIKPMEPKPDSAQKIRKKPGRKPKPKPEPSPSEPGIKKRGWPKGKKRKSNESHQSNEFDKVMPVDNAEV